MISLLLFVMVVFLGYANGANDNFKGVASIYGSKTASYRVSLIWATATTALGSAFSFILANGLLQQFSGKGIVPDNLSGSEHFLLAVAIGAGSTVGIATLVGFPISTTHVSVGSLFGVGLVTGQANPGVVISIVLAWVITLPCAAFLAGIAYWAAGEF